MVIRRLNEAWWSGRAHNGRRLRANNSWRTPGTFAPCSARRQRMPRGDCLGYWIRRTGVGNLVRGRLGQVGEPAWPGNLAPCAGVTGSASTPHTKAPALPGGVTVPQGKRKRPHRGGGVKFSGVSAHGRGRRATIRDERGLHQRFLSPLRLGGI
jgi:hypothetical protein